MFDTSPIHVTPEAAQAIKNVIQGLGEVCVIASVVVEPNCKGFSYKFDIVGVEETAGHDLFSSHGLTFGIPNDDVEFLRGTTLEYGQRTPDGPQGFIFNNPVEDVTLLKEYQSLEQSKS